MATREETGEKLRAKKPTAPRSTGRSLLVIVALSGVGLLAAVGVFLFSRGPGSLSVLTLGDPPTVTPLHRPTDVPTATLPPTLTSTPLPSETPTITTTPSPTPEPSATPIPTATATPLPLPTPDSRDRDFYIPILMYHYISEPPADADPYRIDLSVTPADFRAQMQWLADNDYTPISLYDLIYALQIGNPPLPDNPIILTFDDGYVDNYHNAFPILQEFGFTGTFFILTDVTDREQPGYMTWPMLEEMAAAGHSIEVHGREHLEMTDRSPEWLIYHLRGPAENIAARLGYQPRFLAYPSGRYDQRVIDIASDEGYWGAVTTQHGTHQTKAAPYQFVRLRIRGNWTLDTFAAVVSEGG